MEIANPSSLPYQPLADLSGKASDYAPYKILYLTITYSSQGNLHCHNVKCSPYSTSPVCLLWATNSWSDACCSPLRANPWEMQSPLWDTPALLSYALPLPPCLHKNIQPSLSSHLWAISSHLKCGPYKPFLHIFTAWQEIAVSHSNSGPHFISVFFTIVIDRIMTLCSACCTFYMRAFNFS